MRRARGGLGALGLMLLSTAACAYGRGRTDECRPPPESTTQPADPEQLAGDYSLTLVATDGARAGGAANGRLTLTPQLDSLRQVLGPGGVPYPGVTNPLVGTTTIAVDAVGATAAGDLTASDPAAPGVAMLVRPGETLLRLGSTTNRRGAFQFDGSFTVLRVREATSDRFAGVWSSSGADRPAEGYFCAVRT